MSEYNKLTDEEKIYYKAGEMLPLRNHSFIGKVLGHIFDISLVLIFVGIFFIIDHYHILNL
jgi:hypothetical protein